MFKFTVHSYFKIALIGMSFLALPSFARDWRVINAQGALQSGNAAQAYFSLKNRADYNLGGYAARAQRDARIAAKAQANGNQGRADFFMNKASNQLQNAENLHPARFQNDPYSSADFFN